MVCAGVSICNNCVVAHGDNTDFRKYPKAASGFPEIP